jgi:hypothetical protein
MSRCHERIHVYNTHNSSVSIYTYTYIYTRCSVHIGFVLFYEMWVHISGLGLLHAAERRGVSLYTLALGFKLGHGLGTSNHQIDDDEVWWRIDEAID